MAYKKAGSDNFAEYQFGEGFKSAITGQADAGLGSTKDVVNISRLAQNGAGILSSGLKGYEGYPESYSGYEDIEQVSEMAQKGAGLGNIEQISEMAQKGAGLGSIQDDAFAGLGNFSGYELGDSINKISSIAKDSALDDEINEGQVSLLSDGYGSLDGGPMESFHTYLNRAGTSKTDTALVRRLAKAVKSVPNDTPLSVRKEYYQMALELVKRMKKTKLSYIDVDNVEIQSNLGWLINPSLPKTGGFDSMVMKAVASVGGKLAKGDKEDLKRKRLFGIGEKLKRNLRRTGELAGFEDSDSAKYVGFGLLGLLMAGIVWYFVKGKAPAKRKRRSRKKK